MIQNLLYFVVIAAAMLCLSQLLPGFHVDTWVTAIIAAVVLALVNTLVKPVLFVLTLPFTIITLGLFLLVLNAFMLWLAANLVPGFDVHGFTALLIGSLVLAGVGMVWKSITRKEK